jgi:hypothetical protein
MTTVEDRLEALEDREAIKEIVATYSLHILRDRPSEIPALFIDDGLFRIDSAGLHVSGREALTAFFSRMTPGASYPLVQPAVIKLDGDTALHIGVMENPSHQTGRPGYFGIYEDRLRRTNGGWRFIERSFTFLQGGPPGRPSVSSAPGAS